MSNRAKEARDSFLAMIEGQMLPRAHRRSDEIVQGLQQALTELVPIAVKQCEARSPDARRTLVIIAAGAWQAARDLGIEDELPY